MQPLTVKDLLILCQEEIKKGHGDCSVMISDDDEGNGYHYLYYSFQTITEMFDGESEAFIDSILYNLDTPKDKTIILG